LLRIHHAGVRAEKGGDARCGEGCQAMNGYYEGLMRLVAVHYR